MSGHSKWSTIKRKKGATDAKRSQVFSKMAKLISIAARKGEDPDMNPDLKRAIEKAKGANMPNDKIDNAVKKGSGKTEGAQLEPVRYEAYGPGGTAIIIEGITDNTNRTSPEIKHLLSKNNGTWAEMGAVTWAFEYKDGKWEPKHTVELSETDAQKLDNLLDKLDDHDDVQEIYHNAQ
jgi:YebC/PmpR family DNA-binding regulatory protein